MARHIFQKYSLVPRGGPGLTCDAEGLALGPVVLATKIRDAAGSRRYRLLSREDMIQVLCRAYGPIPETVIAQCCRSLARVIQSLEAGEDALAAIRAVQIGLPGIAPDGMAKLATDALLRKYNPDWENEPRIPAGNREGGQWTSNGDAADARDENSTLLTDVAYQGTYHDQVVAQLVEHWRAQGNKVVTSVDLIARNGATARADIIAVQASGQPPILIEVKTGSDPQYTRGQQVVYPMAQVGDHVYSPNSKIEALGFSPGQWLPAMKFVTIYKRDKQSPYSWKIHSYPIVP